MYRNVKGIKTVIKDVGRLRQILTVFAKHGFGWLITRLKLTDTIGIKNLMQYHSNEAELYTTYERIRLIIEELGPTFIKVGQILSTRPDLVPEQLITQLEKLQNDVPPMSPEELQSQLDRYLSKPTQEAFQLFDKTPLASASVAQVHRATLQDGEQVVVKVLRPNIRNNIERDISILSFLAARAEEMVEEMKFVHPVGVVREFEKAINKEIDLEPERKNIALFAKNFIDVKGIYIPKVYEQFCSNNILVMEFIDGVKVTEAPAKLNVDPYAVGPTM